MMLDAYFIVLQIMSVIEFVVHDEGVNYFVFSLSLDEEDLLRALLSVVS